MFGIGGVEIIVILLVAILLIKPKDLPVFMRKVGKILGEIKKYSRSLTLYIRQAEYSAKKEEKKTELPSEDENSQ